MRLSIQFKSDSVILPVRYKHLIQGWIYSNFPKDGLGKFIHDDGYFSEGKKFKLFVFSDLLGTFKIKNQFIHFEGPIRLEIASLLPEFIQHLYNSLQANPVFHLASQNLVVEKLKVSDFPYFSGEKAFTLSTLSPVTAYRTDGTKVEYFSPDTAAFRSICYQNLKRKNDSIFMNGNPDFSILEISQEKKCIVYFKNTFYVCYRCTLKVQANFRAMNLVLNTGLSSKGSSGFGMVEIKHD